MMTKTLNGPSPTPRRPYISEDDEDLKRAIANSNATAAQEAENVADMHDIDQATEAEALAVDARFIAEMQGNGAAGKKRKSSPSSSNLPIKKRNSYNPAVDGESSSSSSTTTPSILAAGAATAASSGGSSSSSQAASSSNAPPAIQDDDLFFEDDENIYFADGTVFPKNST